MSKKTSNSSNKAELDKAESKIQQECVQWYRNSFCLKHHSPRSMIFSIPNEGRGAASAQLIATGLYPGCADTWIFHREAHCALCKQENIFQTKQFFVEFKTAEGVQSDKQKEFQAHCEEMKISYFIVRSLEQFKQVIANL